MSDEPEKDIQEEAPHGSPQESPTPQPKKRLLPASRIALLIFAALAAVVIVLELRARLPYQSSVKRVEQAMDEAAEQGQAFYQKELDELLSGNPTREYDDEQQIEWITWRGALKKYRMRLRYGTAGFVQGYETKLMWSWED